jgi:hypothetical protein
LIVRASRSATSPSPPNKPSRRLARYGKAQLSVPAHTSMAGAVELTLRRRHPRSFSLPLHRSPVFAISSWTPCVLHLAQTWPALAAGRWRPPRCRDAESAGVAVTVLFSPLGFSRPKTAVGRKPRAGPTHPSPLCLLRPKAAVGQSFLWAGPVAIKNCFLFSFII